MIFIMFKFLLLVSSNKNFKQALFKNLTFSQCYHLKSQHQQFVKSLISPSKQKFDIWCNKGYTDKDEKHFGCYVNQDDVDTFSDTQDH